MTAFTLVAFHAHPDDEVALTAGTMAAAASAGHRVVLVVEADLLTTNVRHCPMLPGLQPPY